MNVPFVDLRAQYLSIKAEIDEAIARVLDTTAFVLGREVEAFEAAFAEYVGARFCVGLNSGTAAVQLAVMACGIGAGDEVIVPANTFFASAEGVSTAGATPVFVDADPASYNLDPSKIEAAITERTRAIMPVHLYGQCALMSAIKEIGARRGIAVVEDAAQAIGADDGLTRAGGIGVIGCFSFYPSKNLGAAGDAGMLTTNDEELANKLKLLRVHGGERRYYHRFIGINSRLDALQAAILRVKLPRLDEWSDARAEKAANYNQLFADAGLLEQIAPPFAQSGVRHIYHQYVIRAHERDELFAHLKEQGIGTDIYYPVPLHMQECFAYLGYAEGDFPAAERAARETLALPVYPELSEEQQQYVVDVIRGFY